MSLPLSFDGLDPHSPLGRTLEHLSVLVLSDTQNPPRAIGTGGMFDYLQAHLPGFRHCLTDHGAGAVSLLSIRGKPRFLFNVHLDTVPAAPTWTRNPHELLVTSDRAIGLGACDIKGAAAAFVSAAACSDGDAAFLFTTDEEANDSRCIPAFLSESHAYDAVLVAEPTRVEAVLAHRGIASVQMRLKGRSGHASADMAGTDSALHQSVRWGARALDFVDAQRHQRFGGLTGLRFNIGRVEGGIKANMIAAAAEIRFGFRPLPSMDSESLHTQFRECVAAESIASYAVTFAGPSLPAGDVAGAEARRLAARDIADELELTIGNAVDFWTEASLFSAAGYTSFVFGPGDIAQAHAADEWVSLQELQSYTAAVIRILNHGH
ncbi:MAG: acetylornithine deacetylase [Tahibacter sp.]